MSTSGIQFVEQLPLVGFCNENCDPLLVHLRVHIRSRHTLIMLTRERATPDERSPIQRHLIHHRVGPDQGAA